VPFSAYDADDIRLLSAALAEAMKWLERSTGHSLTEAETANISPRLARNLMKAFDARERDPDALRDAAPKGFL
jgi:hypothetical protein